MNGRSGWDDLQRWLLTAGAFFMPLVVVWDSYDRFVLPKLLAARALVIVLALVFIARSVTTDSFSWRRSSLDLPLLAFVTSTVLSALAAVNHNLALYGAYLRYEGLLTVVTYAALFWLTVQSIAGPEDARRLGTGAIAGATLASALAIIQSLTGFGPGADTSIGSFVRAFGTMGSPVELGIYLAMFVPLTLHRALTSAPLRDRTLAAAALSLMLVALLLSLTRGAWIAALVGIAIVLVLNRPRGRLQLIGSIALIALVALLFLGFGRLERASPLGRALDSRVETSTDLSQGSVGDRLRIWSDSVQLLARRPLLGYGPDSFGLVYPSVEREGSTPGYDKAHNDILQVAVTNGLVGVLACYLVIATIAVQLWRRRRDGPTAALLAGLIAYEVGLQTEFSWVPAAVPFWIFAGAAFHAGSSASTIPAWPVELPSRLRQSLMAGLVASAAALVFLAVLRPLQADRIFQRAVIDIGLGGRDAARAELASARRINPHEAVYAVEAGSVALDLRFGFRPGAGADVAAARDAYRDAVRLGTTDPVAFRGLAVADLSLGDRAEAIAAALRAVQLNRLDRTSQALLQVVQTPPVTS